MKYGYILMSAVVTCVLITIECKKERKLYIPMPEPNHKEGEAKEAAKEIKKKERKLYIPMPEPNHKEGEAKEAAKEMNKYAQPIRLLLEYVGVEFENKKYQVGPAPDFNKDCWYSEKYKLGLDFPNLPYYIDGEVKLTQSQSILRYLARKHDLLGTTEEEKIACEMMLENSRCFRDSIVDLTYSKDYENLKDEFFIKVKSDLDSFERFLGTKPWFAGDNITVCDFQMYEFLDQLKTMKPGIIDPFPKLQAMTVRFENLPKIKAYMASDRFQKQPFNNPYHSWTGGK